jgi:hypothetical protein
LNFSFVRLFSTPLSWHEGHGHGAPGDGETWWHYFSEPEHWPMSLGVAASVILLAVLGGFALRWAIKNLKAAHRTTRVVPRRP